MLQRVILTLVVAGIIAAWVLTPLRHWLDVARLADVMRSLGNRSLMTFALLACFILGGLLIFPVNVLTAVSVIIFGAMLGAVYALIGVTLNAILLYEIGRRTGRGLLRRFAGGRLNRLGLELAKRGILAMTVLRIVPVAPYSLINLVAGASHLPRRDYIIGTILGMTPGIILNALLVERLIATVHHPQPWNYALLGVTAVLYATASIWVGKKLLRVSAKEA